jgi:Protein of unknown function (DUF2829)
MLRLKHMNIYEAVTLLKTKKNSKVRRTYWGSDNYLRFIDLYSDDHHRVSDKSDIKETLTFYIAKRDDFNGMTPYQFSQSDVMDDDWVEYVGD